MEEIQKYMHEIQTPTEVLWALLGVAGGIARVFGNWLSQEEKPQRGTFIIILIFNIFISGFTGYLGAIVGNLLTGNDQWHVIFAGVFGYLGVNGLEYLSDKVKQKLNLTV